MDNKLLALFVSCVLACSGVCGAPGDESWDDRFGLPPGLDGPVHSIATVGKNVYAAGDFKHAGQVEANGLACWNGQQWSSPLSPDFSGLIYTVASDGKNLYAGGWFVIPSIGATNIAKWSGSSWERLGNGVNQECGGRIGVFALATKNSQVYAAGAFSRAGSVGATNVAVWNGRDWSALGAGLGGTCYDQPYGEVKALALQGNNLYAGGIFHNSGSLRVTNLAVWDGRTWKPFGGGISGGSSFGYIQDGVVEIYSGGVAALLPTGSGLYVGGSFRMAGESVAYNIASWNGKVWYNLSEGVGLDDGGQVNTIISARRGIIVGGAFNRAGNRAVNNVAQWNGSAWSGVGAGFSGPVYALANGDALYAGGDFGVSGGTQQAFMARLDGATWKPLQAGIGNAVVGNIAGAVAAHGKAYLFGNVTSAGSLSAQNVVGWDGSNWNNLGGGIPAFISHGVIARSNLYVGGTFVLPSVGAANIACWNGQSWSALPHLEQLPSGTIAGFAGDDTRLYIGLQPTFISPASIFSWDGERWSQIPYLASGAIRDLVASEGRLYVFGDGYVGLWNGTAWQDLGSSLAGLGIGSPSVALTAAAGNRLYVLAADSQGSGNMCVALWNGVSWQCLLQGMNLPINSLAATRELLYVGGYFTEIGGVAANYIARFDGMNWYPLGSGFDGPPAYRGLAADDDRLYATGLFKTAGGNSSYRFAIWHEP
jgi:trimeric autotransporter adhesin